MQYSPFVINANGGSGYVDITFSAPYTGTTLANGRYIITIADLKINSVLQFLLLKNILTGSITLQ